MESLEAIFVDRDGVLNRERKDYVKSWSEFEFLPGALAALARLAGFGVPILLITNQSVIGRGLAERSEIDEIHARLQGAAKDRGGRIDKVFVCPHRPDEGCGCRKPAPGLLLQAAEAYGLNLSHCIFIGDAVTDALAAEAAGCASLLVRSGRQGDELPALVASARKRGALIGIDIPLVADIVEAVAWIENALQGPIEQHHD
jgi:D-glycero-D-manno-heptose 1,7-bisphosphate phosphatase